VHLDVAAAVRGLATERAARGKQNFSPVLTTDLVPESGSEPVHR
jgi:hypothetical protein